MSYWQGPRQREGSQPGDSAAATTWGRSADVLVEDAKCHGHVWPRLNHAVRLLCEGFIPGEVQEKEAAHWTSCRVRSAHLFSRNGLGNQVPPPLSSPKVSAACGVLVLSCMEGRVCSMPVTIHQRLLIQTPDSTKLLGKRTKPFFL